MARTKRSAQQLKYLAGIKQLNKEKTHFELVDKEAAVKYDVECNIRSIEAALITQKERLEKMKYALNYNCAEEFNTIVTIESLESRLQHYKKVLKERF